MKGRQASDRSPLKTAAGLITQHRTGPKPLGAVPSLSRAATIAATPPAAQDGCDYLQHKKCNNPDCCHSLSHVAGQLVCELRTSSAADAI
jgi:hypothetical protein